MKSYKDESRISKLETKIDNIAEDISEIKEMQHIYLEHKINSERDIKDLKATHRRVAIWASIVCTAAINGALAWVKHLWV